MPAVSAQSPPAPAPAATARSERLTALVREQIERSGGAISFARYMELALYAPGLGYYSAGLDDFGAGGDFVTAPELSPLFSRCLARPLEDILVGLGDGDVLELGAGSGSMAAQLLAALDAAGVAPRRYLILESSPALRERQATRLERQVPRLMERVAWLNELPPDGFRGVIIGNEFLDAQPACRFQIESDCVREWGVGWDDGRFVWRLGASENGALQDAVRELQNRLEIPLAPGYISELSLAQRACVREAASRLGAGALLFLDYGYPHREYYHPQRDRGTLVCYYRHRAHDDPLILTGLQDISVHVDFSAVADEAKASGLELAGFCTQADFLLAAGLLELATEVDPRSPDYPAIARAIKQLTLPGEMGEAIKVMALTRGCEVPLRGFGRRDMRARLEA